jgi:asparagine synthetase B (glutamine-hydrolysing)
MCGIVAFFSSDKRISAERLKRATNSLHHRGPDSQGAWLSPNQRVGLGHARLSIIDLTTGDQPIANEDERIHIVVNGEFYDFERQRRELDRRGHLFRTRHKLIARNLNDAKKDSEQKTSRKWSNAVREIFKRTRWAGCELGERVA